jgi:hypothetical protein
MEAQKHTPRNKSHSGDGKETRVRNKSRPNVPTPSIMKQYEKPHTQVRETYHGGQSIVYVKGTGRGVKLWSTTSLIVHMELWFGKITKLTK